MSACKADKFPFYVLTTMTGTQRQQTVKIIMSNLQWPYHFFMSERRQDQDGCAGCFEAHLRAYLYCIKHNMPYIAIAEDNICLSHDYDQLVHNNSSALSEKINDYHASIQKFLSSDAGQTFDILFLTSHLMGAKHSNFELHSAEPVQSSLLNVLPEKTNLFNNCNIILKKKSGLFSGASAYIISLSGCHKVLQAVYHDLKNNIKYDEMNFFKEQRNRSTTTDKRQCAFGNVSKNCYLLHYENHPGIKSLWQIDLYLHYLNLSIYIHCNFMICRGNTKTTNTYTFKGIPAQNLVNLIFHERLKPKTFNALRKRFFYRVLINTKLPVSIVQPVRDVQAANLDDAAQSAENASFTDAYGIPKILFRTHRDCQLGPDHYNRAHLSWIQHNPTWSIIWLSNVDQQNIMSLAYLTDKGMPSFISQQAQRIVKCFDTLVPGAYRSDLLRSVLLYVFGGAYVDSDAECFVSLDELLQHIHRHICANNNATMPDFLLARDVDVPGIHHELHNGFMITKAQSPFFKQYILDMLYNIEHRYYGLTFVSTTGPVCLGQAVRKVLNASTNASTNFDRVVGTQNTNPAETQKYKGDCMYSCSQGKIYVFDLKGHPSKIYYKGTLLVNKKFDAIKAMKDKLNFHTYAWLWLTRNIFKNA